MFSNTNLSISLTTTGALLILLASLTGSSQNLLSPSPISTDGDRDRRGGRDSRGGDRDSRSRERFERSPGRERERSFSSERPERGDRPERGGDRGERRAPVDRPTDPNSVRLFINLGREQSVRPGDIVGAIAGEARIPGRDIGQIDIYDKFTFLAFVGVPI